MQPKLMGEGSFLLSEKFDQLLSNNKITELITIEGFLKINENGNEKMKQIPVGQASVAIHLQNISISRRSTPSHLSGTSHSNGRSHRNSNVSLYQHQTGNGSDNGGSNQPSNFTSPRNSNNFV